MGPPRRKQAGVTLIELLFVLAIIGIIASIAYPSYAAHLTRARRLEGKVALLEAMQRQEHFYSRANRYLAFSADSADLVEPVAAGLKWWSGAQAGDSAYELRAQACAGAALAECVEVIATPGTPRVDGRFRDTDCGELTLVSTGETRAATGNPGCWP